MDTDTGPADYVFHFHGATTSNKQRNFVQHIGNMLKIDGKAAVVVPGNVLFEGGAGETVRKNLLERTDLHTLHRTNLDIFWLRDESLEDAERLPPPEVLAQEIAEQFEAALEEFRGAEEELADAK